jgi:transcriptional regulator
MYLPNAFSETDRLFALEVMRTCGMATAISWTGPNPQVSHVPVLVDSSEGQLALRFHLALRNGHCAALTEGASCLLTFLGPNCYVSPSWYTEQPNVPTWNYVSVHAYGRVVPMDQDALEKFLADLTSHHEARIGGGFSYAGLPREFQLELLQEIRGFRVEVSELEAKSKLSQNRLPADRDQVTRKLLQSTEPDALAVGHLMAAKFGT